MQYIILAIIGIIVLIVSTVFVKWKQLEEKKYYDAALQMVREEYLTGSLKNSGVENYSMVVKPMLYLKLCSPKPIQGYVFDPGKDINIGRDKNSSSIWIPYPTVSMRHCKIFLYDGRLYLRDENSANGTTVKKGLKQYFVVNGECIELHTKDKIIIEGSVFRVTVFYFQTMR